MKELISTHRNKDSVKLLTVATISDVPSSASDLHGMADLSRGENIIADPRIEATKVENTIFLTVTVFYLRMGETAMENGFLFALDEKTALSIYRKPEVHYRLCCFLPSITKIRFTNGAAR
jgi:hypothetical protein